MTRVSFSSIMRPVTCKACAHSWHVGAAVLAAGLATTCPKCSTMTPWRRPKRTEGDYVREYARRIEEAYGAAVATMPPADTLQALSWYRIEAERLARMASELALPVATVIAAAATLSPATSWHLLMLDLPRFLREALAGVEKPASATYGANRSKAARIVRDRLGIGAVTGPKVSAFARALSGDPSAVVVDRHAARIATGEDDRATVPALMYRACARAYRRVAERAGVEPAGLQALVWTARVGFGGAYGPTE